jgi:hypothetical protein
VITLLKLQGNLGGKSRARLSLDGLRRDDIQNIGLRKTSGDEAKRAGRER